MFNVRAWLAQGNGREWIVLKSSRATYWMIQNVKPHQKLTNNGQISNSMRNSKRLLLGNCILLGLF
jgi:hypothetical protein